MIRFGHRDRGVGRKIRSKTLGDDRRRRTSAWHEVKAAEARKAASGFPGEATLLRTRVIRI
jgi:hypothetical protein